jgi:hypothetical protein
MFHERNIRLPPNNSLKPTRLAGEIAVVASPQSYPRMMLLGQSRRAA